MHRRATYVGLIGLLLSATALADQLDGKEGTDVERITVLGHYDNGLGTAEAASQGAVTYKLIESRPALRTVELLEFVPGMIVSQHSGDGKANQYYLRGFNLDHGTDFATYVDGMPVNMPTHAHGQGYTDLNFVIPELVRRIDYKKGTYYADEGDFASAGAAHMRIADTLNHGVASLTLGENRFARAVLADSIGLGDGTLLYGIELGHNDGPWELPEGFRKVSGVLRYSREDSATRQSLTFMAYSARWSSTDQIPERAVADGSIGRFAAIDPTDRGDTQRYSLSWALEHQNSLGTLTASAYAVRSQLELISNFTYFLDDPVHGDQFQQAERRTVIGGEIQQQAAGQLANTPVEGRIGLQARLDHLSPVGLYASEAAQRIATVREDTVHEGSIGVFAEATARWLPWFRTVAGLRFDSYHFDVTSSLAANSGDASDHIVSPKISAVFGPWQRTEFFLNYGEGFHSNDARGTTQTATPDALTPADSVTPLVKTRGAEFGLRTEPVKGLQSSVALWQLRLGSELVFIGDAGETEASRPSRRHGVEWNTHWVARNWLMLDLDLAWSQAKFTEHDPAGDLVPGSVGKVASFGVSLQELGPWSGAFQLRYFGPRPLIEDGSVYSDATTLAYLRASYRLSARSRLTADIFNLFDSKASDIDYYYTSRLPGEPAEGVNDRHFHPVEPRTLRVTYAYQF